MQDMKYYNVTLLYLSVEVYISLSIFFFSVRLVTNNLVQFLRVD